MKKILTLCLIREGGKILLGMKKRGKNFTGKILFQGMDKIIDINLAEVYKL